MTEDPECLQEGGDVAAATISPAIVTPSPAPSGHLGTRVRVRQANGRAGVFATRRIPAGAEILSLEGELDPVPTRYSVQLGQHAHLREPTNGPTPSPDTPWCFLNHACAPNAWVDAAARWLVALRDIRRGEEVTFDYLTTEWEMAEPFECGCGAARCRGRIGGFSRLGSEQQRELLPLVAPHIRALYRGGARELESLRQVRS